MPVGELCEAVVPARRSPVGGGCIYDPRLGVLDQRYCLDRRCVRQTQEYDIGCIDQLLSLIDILSLVIVYAQQLQIIPAAQALVYLQSRGSFLSVYVYPWFHAPLPPWLTVPCPLMLCLCVS